MLTVFRGLSAGLVIASMLSTTAARGGEPLDLLPADTLLCWYGRPLPDTAPPTSEPSAWTTLLDLGTRIAGQPLDQRAQLNVRILETLGLMVRYSYALALIDAKARPTTTNSSSRRADQLEIALIVQTDHKPEPLLRIIQKVVNEQTDAGKAALQQKEASGWRYQELRDARLPEWCVIGWGEIGDQFVLTVGMDVWPKIAKVAAGELPSLSRNDWIKSIREERARGALLEIFASISGIRQRLDPFLQGRATAFFVAWEAQEIDRGHWALGFEGRALYCLAHFYERGETRARLYADPAIDDSRLIATIPPEARYAIYRLSAGDFLYRFVNSLYATRGAGVQRAASDLWEDLQREKGFNAQSDFLDPLGQMIVLHNQPQHPLRIPLAVTIIMPIEGDAKRVRRGLDAICQGWQELAERAAEREGKPSVNVLYRDADGVWYLGFGPIAGPAWTVTDRFLVASWSPFALRQYLGEVGDKIGTVIRE